MSKLEDILKSDTRLESIRRKQSVLHCLIDSYTAAAKMTLDTAEDSNEPLVCQPMFLTHCLHRLEELTTSQRDRIAEIVLSHPPLNHLTLNPTSTDD